MGEINALINNAGAGRFAGIQEFSMGEIEDVFSLNVKALMQMTMLYLNQFSSTQGGMAILLISLHRQGNWLHQSRQFMLHRNMLSLVSPMRYEWSWPP
ncbi:SDR family NAD(P)-dependent oxidoreductase [Virgibacillus halophilus]|uniref:SDR family NAD(P)-dependent oxidoreductase n=1 Tax=Tigheibacillus halophilus TaxID=361280 RepID=A0ABU5CB02_9BACI|nr:SDR family NAD(P)-dependent oxidoreductase [Virgibacillus halophilus]